MKTLIIILIVWLFPKVVQGTTQVNISENNIVNSRVITARGETEKYIWEGTNEGLYITTKRNGKIKFLTEKHSQLPGSYVTGIVCLPDGQTYIATLHGILLWDNFAFIPITTDNSDLPDNRVTCLALSDRGDLWIGTSSSGIVIGTGRDIKAFKSHPLKTHDLRIFSIVNEPSCIRVTYRDGGSECFRNEISYAYFAIR